MRFFITLLSVLIATRMAYAGDPPIRIVTLGDSITRGERTGVKAEQTFSAMLSATLNKDGIKTLVVNNGIGGERTDQALQRLDGIVKHKPKVLIIMYGTNDSYVDKGAKAPRISPDEYRKNLQKIVADLRKAGIAPILMTPPRWGDKAAANGLGEHPNVSLERYVKVCREVAEETKTPLVDHFAHWTKHNAAGTDIGAWTTDQCHPNPRGHREIMELMLPVVKGALK